MLKNKVKKSVKLYQNNAELTNLKIMFKSKVYFTEDFSPLKALVFFKSYYNFSFYKYEDLFSFSTWNSFRWF